MILYHGTNCKFDKINLSFSKPYKDFGKGFYCTILENQAIEMAKRTVLLYGGTPYVLKFEFDENAPTTHSLNVLKFDKPTEDWANFVMNNRDRNFNNNNEILWNGNNKYDIVVGAVANDAMASAFASFKRGYLNLQDLTERLKYKKLNNQYSFHTNRAISTLKFLEAIKID